MYEIERGGGETAVLSFTNEFIARFDAYNSPLHAFLGENELAEAVGSQSLDHIAYKCANAEHYESVLTSLLYDDNVEAICEIAMPDRRISAVIFKHPPLEGRLTDESCHPGIEQCYLMEIIEPRPEVVGKDVVGIDHIEVLVDSADALRVWAATFEDLSIDHEIEHSPSHEWLSVPIGRQRSELEFTNVPFLAIVNSALRTDQAAWLRYS